MYYNIYKKIFFICIYFEINVTKILNAYKKNYIYLYIKVFIFKWCKLSSYKNKLSVNGY